MMELMSSVISSAKIFEVMAISTCDLARDAFLSNLNNKNKLIVHFKAFYTAYQVEADADAEMVHTAVARCPPSC